MLKKSFSLIEIMVSVFILVVGISGSILVLNSIVANFRLATDVFIANNLAIEGTELVRNIRDNNLLAGREWNHGITFGTHQVDFNDPSLTMHIGNLYMEVLFFQHTTIANRRTPFNRRIVISSCPGIVNCLEVGSIVSWTDIIGDQRAINTTRLLRGP